MGRLASAMMKRRGVRQRTGGERGREGGGDEEEEEEEEISAKRLGMGDRGWVSETSTGNVQTLCKIYERKTACTTQTQAQAQTKKRNRTATHKKSEGEITQHGRDADVEFAIAKCSAGAAGSSRFANHLRVHPSLFQPLL